MTDRRRRNLLRLLALAGIGPVLSLPVKSAESGALAAEAPNPGVATKPIPATGERIPVIGMGTWQTFNVGSDPVLLDRRTEVLATFFELGGTLVDSSPMYGSAQATLGYALEQLGFPKQLFSADKIWTGDDDATRSQMRESLEAWRQQRFDLLQVHNLLSWEAHLAELSELKRAGKIRYLGITTSHGRRHREFAKIMQTHDLDFVQLTYNIDNREVQQRLLPLAMEKGIAVIANRPFGGGALIERLQRANAPLPPWCAEWGIENWPQYLLKYVVGHPAITCAIPATTRVEHMRENMGAARGPLPDAATRQRMLDHFQGL